MDQEEGQGQGWGWGRLTRGRVRHVTVDPLKQVDFCCAIGGEVVPRLRS